MKMGARSTNRKENLGFKNHEREKVIYQREGRNKGLYRREEEQNIEQDTCNLEMKVEGQQRKNEDRGYEMIMN